MISIKKDSLLVVGLALGFSLSGSSSYQLVPTEEEHGVAFAGADSSRTPQDKDKQDKSKDKGSKDDNPKGKGGTKGKHDKSKDKEKKKPPSIK